MEPATLRLIVMLAAIFSCFTLWLIDSWIKYPLFILQVLTITVLYLLVSDYDLKLNVKRIKTRNANFDLMADALLMASATCLLILNVLNVQGGLAQLVLALPVTSILPGYALLSVFGLNRYFSKLEGAVLSYVLSCTFTGFMCLASLTVSETARAPIILSSLILLGMISALKRKGQGACPSRSLTRNIDVLAILIAMAFYALSFSISHPDFALLSGTDISRYHAHSIVLWRTPELYHGFHYLLANLHEAAFTFISNTSVEIIKTGLVALNLMIPLAFYVMAKLYLEDVDVRLPAISAIFYSMFSGLAWIYLAKLELEGFKGPKLSLLHAVNVKTCDGAMYLPQPFMWYAPISLSFTILILQLMLLRKFDIGRKSFVTLFSILTVASYLVHVTEAIILALFLCFCALFIKGKALRLNEALLAMMVGFTVIGVFYAILQFLLDKALSPSVNVAFLLTTAALAITCTYRRFAVRRKIAVPLPKLNLKPLTKALFYVAIFVYLLGLLTWINDVPPFYAHAVREVGATPWFIYPVSLGAVGLLAIVGLYHYYHEGFKAKELLLFVALMAFSVIFGRALTFIHVNMFDAGYWENRLVHYAFLASAVVAPISVIKVVRGLKAHGNDARNAFTVAALIGVLVVCGLQSSFMVVEFWGTYAPSYKMSAGELQAMNFLRETLQRDRRAYTVTLTVRSYNALAFSTSPFTPRPVQVMSMAESPETCLMELRAHNLSHAYLYMHRRDHEFLKHSRGWLTGHLLPMLPLVYRNPEAEVYNVSSVSFPQTSFKTALVVPFNGSADLRKRWLYAYDVLSLSESNYTVVYDLDHEALKHSTLILSIDPLSDGESSPLWPMEAGGYLNYVEGGGRLIVLNTNGYGYFANRMLVRENITVKADRVRGLTEITLPMDITLPKLLPKTEAIKAVAHYWSHEGLSAYAVKEGVGLGEIIYVNVYPIIEGIERGAERSGFYGILGKLLEPLGVRLEPFTYIRPKLAAIFKHAKMFGNIQANSSSIILPYGLNIKEVEAVCDDGTTFRLFNVTGLRLSDYVSVCLMASKLTLSGGRGFYSALNFDGEVTIALIGNHALMNVLTASGDVVQLSNVKAITVKADNRVTLYARQPTVSVQGRSTFTELYAFGATRYTVRTWGQDLIVEGSVKLAMHLSDIYSRAASLNVSGLLKRDPPLLPYDELSSLPQAAFLSLFLAPTLAIIKSLIKIMELKSPPWAKLDERERNR